MKITKKIKGSSISFILIYCCLSGCVQHSKFLGGEPQDVSHRQCQSGDSSSCAIYLESKIKKHITQNDTNGKHKIYELVSFYLRHMCRKNQQESCYMLGLWLAHLRRPCAEVEQMLQKACSNHLWYSCAVLAYPGLKKQNGLTLGPYLLLEARKCYPGKDNFPKRLRHAVCMYSRQSAQKKISQTIKMRCLNQYSWSDMRNLATVLKLDWPPYKHYWVRVLIARDNKWTLGEF